MNRRQAKKDFRKYVYCMPQGRKSKAGIWKKKETRKWHKEMMEYQKYKDLTEEKNE